MAEWLECWTCNQVPSGPPAGFVLGSPKFKSTLVNSQLVRLLPVGFLNIIIAFYLNNCFIIPEKPDKGSG